MSMNTLYGISNCDTIRKAKKWLSDHNVEFNFHDVRKDGLDETTLNNWVNALGWETLLNKRGTTFRQLPTEQKEQLDEASAIKLMLEHPAMIKRPVLAQDNEFTVGFSAENYQTLFNS